MWKPLVSLGVAAGIVSLAGMRATRGSFLRRVWRLGHSISRGSPSQVRIPDGSHNGAGPQKRAEERSQFSERRDGCRITYRGVACGSWEKKWDTNRWAR